MNNQILKSDVITVYHVICNHPYFSSGFFDIAIAYNPEHTKEDITNIIRENVPSFYHTFEYYSEHYIDGKCYKIESGEIYNF